jgi:hypothetical protein
MSFWESSEPKPDRCPGVGTLQQSNGSHHLLAPSVLASRGPAVVVVRASGDLAQFVLDPGLGAGVDG